jgi:hypothetical protein
VSLNLQCEIARQELTDALAERAQALRLHDEAKRAFKTISEGYCAVRSTLFRLRSEKVDRVYLSPLSGSVKEQSDSLNANAAATYVQRRVEAERDFIKWQRMRARAYDRQLDRQREMRAAEERVVLAAQAILKSKLDADVLIAELDKARADYRAATSRLAFRLSIAGKAEHGERRKIREALGKEENLQHLHHSATRDYRDALATLTTSVGSGPVDFLEGL